MKTYRSFRLRSSLALVLWLLSSGAMACDICGCGAGNMFFGFLPNGEKNLVALRYRSLGFDSHIKESGPYADLFRTREAFHIADVVVRFQIKSRLQLQAFLPYAFALQQHSDGIHRFHGMGDALLQVQYRIWDSEIAHPERDSKHQLYVGLGLKSPTGPWRFGQPGQKTVANPNFQPGTGSWDGLFTWQYQMKAGKWILWQDGQLRGNGENPDGYRFGRRLTGNLNGLFRAYADTAWRIYPLLGVYAETGARNRQSGKAILETGGELLLGNLGVQIHRGKASVQCLFQTPLSQNLAEGHIRSRNRFLVQMGWSF